MTQVAWQAFSWNAVGHKIVALIASDQFTDAERKKIAAKMGDWVAMASEPDEYREISNALSAWHYIDYPWVVEPTVKPIHLVEKNNNIVWALGETRRVLAKKNKPHQEAIIQIFRANLIHLMGDLHQPLHCISRVTEAHPKGDMGGNKFDVKLGDKTETLHHFWDGGLGLLENLSLDKTSELSKQIQKEYPKNKLKIAGSFEEWSKESYFSAQKHVYNTPENAPVSQEYIEQGQKVVKERLALAGYRLSVELRNLFL
jgi:hypothetical protein